MQPVTELMEQYGLITREAVRDFCLKKPLPKILELQQEIEAAVRAGEDLVQPAPADPIAFYNFMASSVLRGDTCSYWKCRLGKSEILARYAALYADQIIIPLWVEPRWPAPSESDIRGILLGALLSVAEFRPVYEAGIVKLVRSDLNYCEKCLRHTIPNAAEVLDLAKHVTRQEAGEFAFYASREHDEVTLEVRGSFDYFEHGEHLIHVKGSAPWVSKLRHLGSKQIKIPPDFVKSHGLARYVVNDFAEDVILHNFNRMRFKCKYLARLPGEARFLSEAGKQAGAAHALKAAQLSHDLPILKELPVETALRLRREDGDAFQLYRAAVERVAKEINFEDIDEQKAEEVFQDFIQSPLIKLRARANAGKKIGRVRQILRMGTASVVTLAMGVASALAPAEFAKLFETAAGCTYIKNALDSILETTVSADIRSDDLYFLLRASEEVSH